MKILLRKTFIVGLIGFVCLCASNLPSLASVSYEKHMANGKDYLQKQALTEAAQEFREALGLKPNSFEARLALGQTLFNASQYEQALVELYEAERLDSNNTDVHYQIGLTLMKRLDFDEAGGEFRHVLDIILKTQAPGVTWVFAWSN